MMTNDVDLQALLNPDWSQDTFASDLPDWLDDLNHVMTDLHTAVGGLLAVAEHAAAPAAVLDRLRQLPEITTDAVELTSDAAHVCRNVYESYEIPNLGG